MVLFDHLRQINQHILRLLQQIIVPLFCILLAPYVGLNFRFQREKVDTCLSSFDQVILSAYFFEACVRDGLTSSLHLVCSVRALQLFMFFFDFFLHDLEVAFSVYKVLFV